MFRTGETALMVPMPSVDPVVEGVRRVHDSSRAFGVPAHITVLYPFLDGPSEDALGELAEIVVTVPAFEVVFGEVRAFPGWVLWLAPEPDGPFRRLTAAVADAFGCPPYGGMHGEPTPHLTVAEGVAPGAVDLGGLGLPLRDTADCVELIEFDGTAWRRRRRFSLGS
jgi:2'-5' RNA ligase